MGKRYYCDFCDKTFPYNTANRKKHNEGSYHQMARNAYYSKFKDLKTLLDEEKAKKPCFRFLNYGACAFGNQCFNSHKSPKEMQYLEDLYNYECHKKASEEEKEAKTKAKRRKNKKNKHSSETKLLLSEHLNREENEILRNVLPKFEIPITLFKRNLPISLQPPSYKDLIDFDLNTWPTLPH